MKRLWILLFLFASSLMFAGCQRNRNDSAAPLPTAEMRASGVAPTVAPRAIETPVASPSAPVTQEIDTRPGAMNRDVTYCAPDGIALKMDLAYPKSFANKPTPIAVFIHGGGWTSGDKSGGGGVDARELLARGYIVASLDYRLAPQYKFPAQITDVKCAIRHLRAHAAKYQLDPNRIGVWGSSAGGHLVALLGTSDASVGFDVGEYLDQSSRVQLVVDLFGPADLPAMFTSNAQVVGNRVFGSTSRDDLVLVKASPVTYVSKDDPPFLILQGDQDKTVPLAQSQILHDKLLAGGVPSTLVIVKNGGHGFAPTGGAINPTRAELTKTLADFFDKHLKR
ncbi:MAG: alpha/beta hydrolase [Chloroflexi bacterium]|nr:alpha/beta hydrolase [Chloroflexota bacterium]